MGISELLATLRIAIDKSVVEADIIFDSSRRLVDETEALGGMLKSAYRSELSAVGREEWRAFHEAACSSFKAFVWKQEKLFFNVIGQCGLSLDEARVELIAFSGYLHVWEAHQLELSEMVKDIDIACQKLHLASVQYAKFYAFVKYKLK